jgi:hypothetical protein
MHKNGASFALKMSGKVPSLISNDSHKSEMTIVCHFSILQGMLNQVVRMSNEQ